MKANGRRCRVVCMRASGTRSVGNNTPKWPFPNVNDFAGLHAAPATASGHRFLVRCDAAPLFLSLSPRSLLFLSLTLSHTLLSPSLTHTHSHSLSLSHTLALPLALPLPLLYSLRLGKKAFSCITRGPDYQVSRSVSATRDLRSACSISKSRLMHCVECERRLLLVRTSVYTIRTMKE